jgi:hypothetical protein
MILLQNLKNGGKNLSDSDSGFAPREEEDEKEPICGGPPPPTIPAMAFTASDGDLQPPLSKMCQGGYHGMCQSNYVTCRCSCHKATIRKPIF